MLFDGRTASAQGAALAAGMTIDSLDGHDGFNMAKGILVRPCSPRSLHWAMNNRFQGVRFCWQPFWAMNLAHARRWHNMQQPQIITLGQLGRRYGGGGRGLHPATDTDQTRHALGIAEYSAAQSDDALH